MNRALNAVKKVVIVVGTILGFMMMVVFIALAVDTIVHPSVMCLPVK